MFSIFLSVCQIIELPKTVKCLLKNYVTKLPNVSCFRRNVSKRQFLYQKMATGYTKRQQEYFKRLKLLHNTYRYMHTHTHTYIHIHTYIYIYYIYIINIIYLLIYRWIDGFVFFVLQGGWAERASIFQWHGVEASRITKGIKIELSCTIF